MQHEGVSAHLHVGSAIVKRTVLRQLLIHHVHPRRFRVVVALHTLCIGESEVLAHAFSRIGRVGTAALRRSAIRHVDGHAAVAHEQCHGIGLLGGIVAFHVSVAHVLPVIEVVREVGRHRLTVIIDGALAQSVFRRLVVVQHLRQRRGHAAREATCGSAIDGTQIIIRSFLVPLGGEHRLHARGIFIGVGLRDLHLHAMSHYIAHGLVHGIEPPLEVGVATLTIFSIRNAQHLRHQVVGRDDSEAASLGIAHD